MKVCTIQPPYTLDAANAEENFQWMLRALDDCDGLTDLIVLPEYSNRPIPADTREELLACCEKYTEPLLKKVEQTAMRCGAVVFVNCIYPAGGGYRNTTIAFDRQGRKVGYYYKEHPVQSEISAYGLDSDYTYRFTEPTVMTIDGVRYGFITCYDTYFYEAFSNLARQNVDVIISCSFMRSDPHPVLELLNRFCAYNCNAWMVRSSVSMGTDSRVGGCSMIISPDGTVLQNLHSAVGMATAEIDPHKKYYKPAGYGNPPAAHYEYIELGRRPWKYRPAGSAIVCPDKLTAYPRTGICPDTSDPTRLMAECGAAVALDEQELHLTVSALSAETLERIFRKFACHILFDLELDGLERLAEIRALAWKYDCGGYVTFTSADETVLSALRRELPGCRLTLDGRGCPDTAAETALRLGANGVLLRAEDADGKLVAAIRGSGLHVCIPARDRAEKAALAGLGADILLSGGVSGAGRA